MKKAVCYGILSSLFFAVTFVLNRSMNLGGGFWMWSACLRYIIMLPLLAMVLQIQNRGAIGTVLASIRQQPGAWLLWSTVGFGLFYLPLTCASVFGESWFVAASWQITIVCGVLLTPLFGKRIPLKNILTSLIILAGIALLQVTNLNGSGLSGSFPALLFILIAAFSYPLGNRRMMQICPPGIDTTGRVFGMTLCSMPFWIVTAVIAFAVSGLPSAGQTVQSAIVALSSGVIATILFFHATEMVRDNPKQLALVEATQCGEVLFTLLGGVLLLGDSIPGTVGMLGIALIVLGMILGSLVSI